MRIIKYTIASLFICSALSAYAQNPEGLSISGQYMRFIMASRPAAGYFTITNTSKHAYTLTKVESPACGNIMLHKSTHANGMANMEMLKTVNIPAKGSVSFQPGGLHLMCMSPAKNMTVGANIELTFSFDQGEKLTASFPVQNVMGEE